MSSTSDAYQCLLVQTLPKSILKKSPSPRFSDKSVHLEHEHNPHVTPASPSEAEKNDSNSNQCADKSILLLLPIAEPIMTSDETSAPYEIDHRLMRTVPCADSSSSSSSGTSDDDQQKRVKTKTKKLSSRPAAAANGAACSSTSSSDSNDERKVKRSMAGSKLTGPRSDKHRHKDMQLDEFMRKYQQQGGIDVPTNEAHGEEQTSAANPTNNDGNNYPQSSITHQRTPRITNDAGTDDETTSFLMTMNTISLSARAPSSLQLLFDVAHTDQRDRRAKIDRLRQYVEEQIGISAFLTVYKLIKSSQIPIDIRQKPFCYYAKFLPHLCCLIMLESEEQRHRV